ncbi:MAG: cyclic nucleotide-binding domain-containing protein [Verrucomicrobiota bacterium]
MNATATQVVPASTVDTKLLAGIPLFSRLNPNELQALAGLLKTRAYAESQFVMLIGDNGTEFFILQEGKVEISQTDQSGKEVRLAELGPGNFFGEISLLDGGPRTATVRAITPIKTLYLERQQFIDFLQAHPITAVHILQILGSRQRDLLEKLKGIRNVNEAVGGQESRLEKKMSRVAGIFASEKFLVANLAFIVVWMIIHLCLGLAYRPDKITLIDDAPTFFWLGFMITTESILISMFVLNSQKRQAERDRVRADLEYQVNVKAHMEVMELHRKVDRLLQSNPERKQS